MERKRAKDGAMKRRPGNRRNPGKRSGTEKLLSLPGIKEAMELVNEHAAFLAVDEVLDAASRGELGDELRQLLNDGDDALDEFFGNGLVESCVAESRDEFLEELAVEAGPKIAELWELSDLAGWRLALLIYWGTNPKYYNGQSYGLPLLLVVKVKEAEQENILISGRKEFEQRHAVIVPPEAMQDDHIYLDVTYLPREALLLAYKAVLYCRKQLRTRTRDLREGAPQSADGEKALRAVKLQRTKGSKAAATELGFRIYTSDNPSGSYPLFRKYVKLGQELEQKLRKLETFLSGLEANLRRT